MGRFIKPFWNRARPVGQGVARGGGGASPLTKSVDFDGLTQYSQATGVAPIIGDGTSDWSASLWVRGSSGDQLTVYGEGATAANELRLSWRPSDGSWSRAYLTVRVSNISRVLLSDSVIGAPYSNQWALLACGFRASTNTWWLRVHDRSEKTSVYDIADVSSTWTTCQFGASLPATLLFDGRIFKAGFFGADIASDIAGFVTANGADDWTAHASIVRHYAMGDGDTLPTLTDSVGGINHTAINGPSIETDSPASPA